MTRNSWKPLILTKEWMVAFFLPTYLIFPVLNSLEFAIFFTQGSSFRFVVFLIFGLRIGFWISSNFYDRVVEFSFGTVLANYFRAWNWCLPLLERSPQAVGVLYGCCLLSPFMRFEFSDEIWIYVVSSVFYTIRNLLIFPFIGINLLSFWIVNETARLETLDQIPREMSRDLRRGLVSFESYDLLYSRYHPLILGRKHQFSLETRRGLFQVIMQNTFPLTTRGIIKWTVGTTAGGSVVLAGFSYGREKDRYVQETHKEINQVCQNILTHSNRDDEKSLAVDIMYNADFQAQAYTAGAGGTIVMRGLKTIVDAKAVTEPSKGLTEQFYRSAALEAASRVSGQHREKYLTKAAGSSNGVSTPTGKGVASPIEPEMWCSVLEIVKF